MNKQYTRLDGKKEGCMWMNGGPSSEERTAINCVLMAYMWHRVFALVGTPYATLYTTTITIRVWCLFLHFIGVEKLFLSIDNTMFGCMKREGEIWRKRLLKKIYRYTVDFIQVNYTDNNYLVANIKTWIPVKHKYCVKILRFYLSYYKFIYYNCTLKLSIVRPSNLKISYLPKVYIYWAILLIYD